jgi:hypothetical protein
MATCPKCHLPNPDEVPTCIWCGGHRFAQASHDTLAEETPSESGESSRVKAPRTSMPPVESIHTPHTPAPEYRPLPSHVGLLLTPRPKTGPARVEPRTVATSPEALATQQAAVATPPPSDTAVPKLQPKLIVLRGQKVHQEYPLYDGRNVIGRFADRPVDIDLVAQEAEGQIWSSRQHAAITFDNNFLVVEDLNSLNGTWVNGARLPIGQKRPLKPNDVIQIGTVQLKLVIL